MEIDLFTRSGDFVANVGILPYATMPEVINWGTRFFVLREDGKYYEGFVSTVSAEPATRKHEGNDPQTCPRRSEGPQHDVEDQDQWTLEKWKFTDVEEARKWNEQETRKKNEEDAAKGYKGHTYCNTRYWLWPGPGPKPRTCSYCGCINPEDALRLKREFKYETEGTRKKYKVYMHLPGHDIGMVNVMANMQAGVDPIESLKGQTTPEIYPPLKAYSPHFTEGQWKELIS